MPSLRIRHVGVTLQRRPILFRERSERNNERLVSGSWLWAAVVIPSAALGCLSLESPCSLEQAGPSLLPTVRRIFDFYQRAIPRIVLIARYFRKRRGLG